MSLAAGYAERLASRTATGLVAFDETGAGGAVHDRALWEHLERLGPTGLNKRRREIDRLAREERIGQNGGRWKVDPIPLVFEAEPWAALQAGLEQRARLLDALLTDLYQLTMACGYWRSGIAEREAVFHLHFRKNPFEGGYAVACGLHAAIAWLDRLRFTEGDLAYLRTLPVDADGRVEIPVNRQEWASYLRVADKSLIRELRAMQNDGLLEVDGRHIRVL